MQKFLCFRSYPELKISTNRLKMSIKKMKYFMNKEEIKLLIK